MWSTLPQTTSLRCFNIFLPVKLRSSEYSYSFRFFNQNPKSISLLCHLCNLYHPFHPPWFDHSSKIWLWMQIMNLTCSFLQSPVTSFLLETNTYLPQQPILIHPYPLFFLQHDRPCFTSTQNVKWSDSSVYLKLYIFL